MMEAVTSAPPTSPARGARLVLVSAFTIALLGHAVLADELWVGSGDAGAIHIRNAQISRIESGQIFFTAGGNQTSREVDRVQRILVDGEPAFNAAEEAFATGRWNDAVDGYQRTMRSTTKQWLRDWSTARLVAAGSKSGRFDAAASAYIALLLRDPASAASIRPEMPGSRSTYLDQAVNEVNQALASQKLTDEQRQALLAFLLDLQRARQDKHAEARVVDQLDELLAKDPTNPHAAAALTRRKLSEASKALDAQDYRGTIAVIQEARTRFTDPEQQAEALFLLAEANYGLADRNDPAALKDAALAYMRVVAHFKDDASRAWVGQALLRTAAIHEQLGENRAAASLYHQIVQQMPDDPAARAAQAGLQRLEP